MAYPRLVPILLSNIPRDYAWGSLSLLAQLENRNSTGQPEAEVWFGDHFLDPADCADGTTLDQHTGGRLSYLVKLLAVGNPLSIQVHPTKLQAERGFAQQSEPGFPVAERSYQDSNHKPELVVALSESFEALVGLRDVTSQREVFAQCGDGRGVRELLRRIPTTNADSARMKQALGWLFESSAEESVAEVTAAFRDVARPIKGLSDSVRQLALRYPGDPGVVVAAMMNHQVLRRGEGLFVHAGMLHAYLSGLSVEVMAASDNVLRAGLTTKHIDIPGLLEIVDPVPGESPVLSPDADGHYPIPVPDFRLQWFQVAQEMVLAGVDDAILLVTAGEIWVGDQQVSAGGAVYCAPGENQILIRGLGEVFLARGVTAS